MLSRRALIAAALLSTVPSRLGVSTVPATIAMTFDTDVTTYPNALFDMDSKGIPGTFFADADRINTADCPTRDNLLIMAMKGWEIGARVYGTLNGAEANMLALMNSDRGVAFARLKAAKDLMYAQGFDIKSIAAAQRAWAPQLRGMAAQLFDNVRVADHVGWGSYPILDRLYVRDGGSVSWTGTDTVASLSAQLDALIATGGYWIPIIHRVDSSGDPLYTVQTSVFQGFTAYLQTKIAAGQVRAVTFSQAMQP